jgi:hypothetical protein
MSRSPYYFSLVFAAAATSLVAFSAHAIPFLPYRSPLPLPNVTLVAEICAAGYTLHPRLHLCVAKPTCSEGSTWHPRLRLCVAQPTCSPGSTWHPRLHRCVGG